jgi:cyclohexanone monooxygenase
MLRTDPHWIYAEHRKQIIEWLGTPELTQAEEADVNLLANYATMSEIRQRIDEEVNDPEVARILKPWYPRWCKRTTYNDDFLAAFNRPNVTLIDVSQSKGVERITEKGLVADGVEYQVDCIVFASGFELSAAPEDRFSFPILGRNGKSLRNHWRAGMRSLHGIMTTQFPNMFVLGGRFTGTLSPSYTTPVDGQARHVTHIVRELAERGARCFEPSLEAEDAWVAMQLQGGSNRLANMLGAAPESCTPGYYNQEGRPVSERRDVRTEVYPRSPAEYWRTLEDWRAEGNLQGLVIER